MLGRLAVPGATIASELPAGRFWIGLPLGIAAIVFGARARRQAGGSRRATAAIAIAAVCIGQMAIYTAVSALT